MSNKRKNKLIAILGAVAALGPLSIDMYLPGFSAIARDLHTNIGEVSLSLTAYFIGISTGQLVYGPLLDRYGRKKPLLVGFGLYLLAAIACALAPSIELFILYRLLLAFGGCVGMVASRAIIRDHFESNEIARAFSSLILVMGAAPIVAPSIGGQVVAHFGWRYIFWFLAAYAGMLLFLVRFALRESHRPDPGLSLRPKAVGKQYWSVLQNRDFYTYGLAGTIGIGGMFGYIAGSPFVIMEMLNFSETAYGWLFGANALGFIASSQINRALLKKRNSEELSRWVSLITLGLSVFLAFQSGLGIPQPWLFLSGLFFFMCSLGFINPNLQALALSPFKKQAGVASALVGAMRMMGGAIASALIGLLHNATAMPMTALMALAALGVAGMLWQRYRRDLIRYRTIPLQL